MLLTYAKPWTGTLDGTAYKHSCVARHRGVSTQDRINPGMSPGRKSLGHLLIISDRVAFVFSRSGLLVTPMVVRQTLPFSRVFRVFSCVFPRVSREFFLICVRLFGQTTRPELKIVYS